MKILISCYSLDLSGVSTYTLALYNELVKLGHSVSVYSLKSGELKKEMKVVKTLNQLEKPDMIIAQANSTVPIIKKSFPDVPMIFSSHGTIPNEEQKPSIEVEYYTAINEAVERNLISQGVDSNQITIVRDFIETERFKPIEPLNNEVKKVLYISNRKKWKVHSIIKKACENLYIEFKAIGMPYGKCFNVEKEINQSDLVITLGRGILEAMSCSRAVISFDQTPTTPSIIRGDGYITSDVYFESRQRNFMGENSFYTFNVESMVEEIKKYNWRDGAVNRKLILEYHNSEKIVNQILEII